MLWHRATRVKSFDEELARLAAFEISYVGFKTILVEQVVGSVDRAEELNGDFTLDTEESRDRFDRIMKAMDAEVGMPAIEVYQIRDGYYVVDGHHRVAVARRRGQVYIDAIVTEYMPIGGGAADVLYRERREFEHRTGLHNIVLTEAGQYDKLQNQIDEHRHYMTERRRGPVSVREAAEAWRDSVYRPVVEEIERRGFERKLRGRTPADFYVYVCDHKWLRSRALGRDLGFAAALDEFEGLLGRDEDRGWVLRTIRNMVDSALGAVMDFAASGPAVMPPVEVSLSGSTEMELADMLQYTTY